MPIQSASDFETMFDPDMGSGYAGTVVPLVGLSYSCAAILRKDVEMADEDGNIRDIVTMLTFLRSSTNNLRLPRGTIWTMTDTSESYTIQTLEKKTQFTDRYIVTLSP